MENTENSKNADRKLKLKFKAALRPGTAFSSTPKDSIVEVDEAQVVKIEGGGYGILNPKWDPQFENAMHRPMPKYSVIFEEVA
jgi:hypothetical protein